MAVTKRVFESGETSFEPRYFEIEPQGYTSFEKHAHEHFVVVLRGKGQVRLDDQEYDLNLHDMVHVKPNTPHQFSNPTSEPFGILCVVDKERDRPVLLEGSTQ
jgi:quercetin dioxygenase-like cupin family protein